MFFFRCCFVRAYLLHVYIQIYTYKSITNCTNVLPVKPIPIQYNTIDLTQMQTNKQQAKIRSVDPFIRRVQHLFVTDAHTQTKNTHTPTLDYRIIHPHTHDQRLYVTYTPIMHMQFTSRELYSHSTARVPSNSHTTHTCVSWLIYKQTPTQCCHYRYIYKYIYKTKTNTDKQNKQYTTHIYISINICIFISHLNYDYISITYTCV